MAGGTWSKRVALGEAKVPVFSWFCAVAPDGAVHLAWSQVTKDTPSTYVNEEDEIRVALRINIKT